MTGLVIALLIVAGYLATGAWYARSQALTIYQRIHADFAERHPSLAKDKAWTRHHLRLDVSEALWARFFAWPVLMIRDRRPASRRGAPLFGGAIAAAREEAARLRSEADAFDPLVRATRDEAERKLLRTAQASMRAEADRLDP